MIDERVRLKTIGTCSVCSGPVVVQDWGGWTHPDGTKPECRQCGAVPRTAHGPTIDMIPLGHPARIWADLTPEQRSAALNMGVGNG